MPILRTTTKDEQEIITLCPDGLSSVLQNLDDLRNRYEVLEIRDQETGEIYFSNITN
jgi:hypothetical protein